MRYRHAILAGPFSHHGIHGYEHLELQDDQPILGDEEIDGRKTVEEESLRRK